MALSVRPPVFLWIDALGHNSLKTMPESLYSYSTSKVINSIFNSQEYVVCNMTPKAGKKYILIYILSLKFNFLQNI